MRQLLADLRLALRGWVRTPGFTVIAVTSIALGIGATTAIFTLVDQVLLRRLPVQAPHELVQVRMEGSLYGNNWGDGSELSFPWYRELRDEGTPFSGVLGRFATSMHLGVGGRTERLDGEVVTGSYFPVLGVRPAAGRLLTETDDREPGAHPVAVLSYGYWQARFAGDPAVVGRHVVVNGHPFTIVGVAQEGFAGIEVGRTIDLFVPTMMKKVITPGWYALDERTFRWVRVMARLKPGTTPAQAQVALQGWARARLEADLADKEFAGAATDVRTKYAKNQVLVEAAPRGRSHFRHNLTTPLWVLLGIAVGVLVIACANVANLLLARAAGRQREMALRLALGAGRWRLVRQLLIESLLLGAAGGLAGLAVALIGAPLVLSFFVAPDSPAPFSTLPDTRILAFSIGVSALTSLIFGLVPALRSTTFEVASTLKAESGSVAGAHPRLRKALVASQVALSLLLLTSAGLFIRTLHNLTLVDIGIKPAQLFAFEVDSARSGYTSEQTRQFARSLLEQLASAPGMESAALATMRILQGNQWSSAMTVEGHAPVSNDTSSLLCNSISPGYFSTMGMRLIAGRDFERRDAYATDPGEDGGYRVAIVNEEFAKKYFPAGGAVGRHIGFGTDPGTKTPIEIVGVVSNAKYTDVRNETRRQAFFPYFEDRSAGGFVVYARTRQDTATAMTQARRIVQQLDANIPVSELRTLEHEVDLSLSSERMMATMSAVFGALATTLAVVGLYGVMAYTVARRTREIGIRMALGARGRDVGWMVMREALVVVAAGAAIGLPAAWWLSRYVESQLFGVGRMDFTSVAAAVVAMAIVSAGAALTPAQRAARVEPMTALRYE